MKKYLILLFSIIFLFACKKDIIDNTQTATLHFSTDTITFDTIFASIGSITKTLTVYNRNDFNIQTDIELKGTSAGHFRMNVDGNAGNTAKNIEIPKKDSIFIFLEVTIDPSSNNTPYILADSLVFTTGTNEQDVDLIAWGQDAYFHTPNTFGQIVDGDNIINFPYHRIDCSIPWENDKPHVIYGYAIVDPFNTLIINEGSSIYLHNNSGILVGNPFDSINNGGSIKVNGSLGNEVTFQGDRLDSWYRDIPGQWDRIWLMPGSINNEINYAIIKNGTIGIHADTVSNSNPSVSINNTIIKNMSAIGILGQGAHIEATNTVISKCGQYSLACIIGGTYNFTHCTFANYWNYSNRNTPSILLNNYYEGSDGNIYIRDLNSANFINCIIDGNLSTEVSFQEQELGHFNYTFDHCLIKLDPTINTNNGNYENVIINQSPEFTDNTEDNFHLESNSPAIDAGNPTVNFEDIEGNTRNNPDLGAFEFKE